MARYSLLIKPSAAKELAAVDLKKARQRLVEAISHLADQPRPPGCRKLTGAEKYRLRSGDYRVLYAVDDEAQTVTVVRVAHRRDAYR